MPLRVEIFEGLGFSFEFNMLVIITIIDVQVA